MRKCYIIERGIKYEEFEGNDFFWEGMQDFPRILYCTCKKPRSALRMIEGKLWFLVGMNRLTAYYPVGEEYPHTRFDVFKKSASKFNMNKVIGEVVLPDDFGNEDYECFWAPLTTDMLHVPEEQEGSDEQGDS